MEEMKGRSVPVGDDGRPVGDNAVGGGNVFGDVGGGPGAAAAGASGGSSAGKGPNSIAGSFASL